MSVEPSDEVIKNEIISNVASMQVHMRTNKLRKIICKKVSGTKWTQYQKVLDSLIKDGSLKTQEVNGESLILSLNDKAAPAPPKQDEGKVIVQTIEVPFDIILYLCKQGHKKKKNIEVNTKTKMSFDADTNQAMWNNLTNVKKSTLTVTKTWSPDDSTDQIEAKEVAMKQIKAAKLMISQMLKSFKDNPDHFEVKKAGGTLAEQDEAKKKKLEATKKHRKKKSRNDDGAVHDASKKQRKFY